jgi:hypothetical protein
MAAKRKRTYQRLQITARDPKTEIWVSDEDGHLVQKETGRMDTRLLPGRYKVRFGCRRMMNSNFSTMSRYTNRRDVISARIKFSKLSG